VSALAGKHRQRLYKNANDIVAIILPKQVNFQRPTSLFDDSNFRDYSCWITSGLIDKESVSCLNEIGFRRNKDNLHGYPQYANQPQLVAYNRFVSDGIISHKDALYVKVK